MITRLVSPDGIVHAYQCEAQHFRPDGIGLPFPQAVCGRGDPRYVKLEEPEAQITCRYCRLRAQRARGVESSSWKGFGGLSGRLWCFIKRSAKVRGWTFEITIEDAWRQYQKQKGLCALTGCPISLSKKPEIGFGVASLDRIDNTKGYLKENIQWLHKDVNLMKGRLDQAHFVIMCQMVARMAGETP